MSDARDEGYDPQPAPTAGDGRDVMAGRIDIHSGDRSMVEKNGLIGHPGKSERIGIPDLPPIELTRFDTGAVRSIDANATRYDLISPIALEEIAKTYAEGSVKYSDFNWEKGMPVHDLLNHAIRHIYLFLSGDRSEPHFPHAAWGLMAAIHSHALWPELNAAHLRTEGCKPPVGDGKGGGE